METMNRNYTASMKGILEFYPDAIKRIAENDEVITEGLAHDQLMVIDTIKGNMSDRPNGYNVEIYDISNERDQFEPCVPIAQLEIKPYHAFVYYNRTGTRVPELYTLTLPAKLRNKVAWALGFSRKLNAKHSRTELREHYNKIWEQYEQEERIDGYVPEYFAHGRFSAVIAYSPEGEAVLTKSAYHVNGFPTYEEALDVLELVSDKANGWYFSTPEKVNYVISAIKANKPSSCF